MACVLRGADKASVQAQAQRTAAKQAVLEYRTLLSETMLAQGLSNVGDSRRMERFLQKLLNGEHHVSLTA